MKFASAVETAPYYLDCENVLDRTEQTNCSFYKIKEYIQQIAEYPDICRDAGIQGTVHVKFVVSTTGDIQDVEVYRSVHSRLDKEAVKAVKALPNMEPATHNGIRVPVIYTIPVDFIITGH